MESSRYFKESEMACTHCGKVVWDQQFMDWLDTVRFEFGKPMVVSSGYRCKDHPIEKAKSRPGSHNTGRAVDILVSGEKAIELVSIAYRLGCRRVGVHQKGDFNSRFIHIDKSHLPNAMWTY